MKVLDSGHRYELKNLDEESTQILVFVKREGEGYPGNVGSYPGTTMQEVLRALVQRAEYVNDQIYSEETAEATQLLKKVIWLFEQRAAKRHNRSVNFSVDSAVYGDPCGHCNHIGCRGGCKKI